MSEIEEQVAKLKAEHYQLQTRLFHIEHVVLPGKTAEINQLLVQIANQKLEKTEIEQHRIHAISQSQEHLTTMNVGKENAELKEKLTASQEEVQKLETQRNELLEVVQLLKQDLSHTANRYDIEKRVLEDKLKILQEEKQRFLNASSTVIKLYSRYTNETSKDLEESDEYEVDCEAAHTKETQDEVSQETPEIEGTPRMTRSAKRPRLSATFYSESPTVRIGVEFHSVDKSVVDAHRCICGKTLSNRQTLKTHVKRYGENNYPFACLKCPKRYISRAVLKQHEYQVHGMHMQDTSSILGQDDEASDLSCSEDDVSLDAEEMDLSPSSFPKLVSKSVPNSI